MESLKEYAELREFLTTPQEFYFTDDTKIPNNIDSVVEVNGTNYHLNVSKSNFDKVYIVSFGRMVTSKVRLWSIRPKDIKVVLSTFLKMMESTQALLGTKVDGYVIKVPAKVDVAKYNKFMRLIIKKTYIQTFRPVDVQEVKDTKYPFKYLFLCRKVVHPTKIFSSKQFSQYAFDVKTSSIKGEALIPIEPKRKQKVSKSLNPAKNIEQLMQSVVLNDLVAFSNSEDFEKALNAKGKSVEATKQDAPINDATNEKINDYQKLIQFYAAFYDDPVFWYDFSGMVIPIKGSLRWSMITLPNEPEADQYFIKNASAPQLVANGATFYLYPLHSLVLMLMRTNFHKFHMWTKDKFDILYTFNVALKYLNSFNETKFLDGSGFSYQIRQSLKMAIKNLEKIKVDDPLKYTDLNDLARQQFPVAFKELILLADKHGIKVSFFDLLKNKYMDTSDIHKNLFDSKVGPIKLSSGNDYYELKNKQITEVDLDFQYDHLPFEFNEDVILKAYAFNDTGDIPLEYKWEESKQKFKESAAYRQFQLQASPEMRAIQSYTGGTYRSINAFLRNPQSSQYEHVASKAEKCVKAFYNIPKLEQPVWVTRDAAIKPMEGNVPWPVEKIFFDPAVQSCSADLTWDWGYKQNQQDSEYKNQGKCKLLIYVPKGASLLPVMDYSQNPSEREVILPPGSLYRPIKVFYSERVPKHSAMNPSKYDILPVHIIVCVYIGAALDYLYKRVKNRETIFQEGLEMSMKDFLNEQKKKNEKKKDEESKGVAQFEDPKKMEKIVRQVKSGKIKLQK